MSAKQQIVFSALVLHKPHIRRPSRMIYWRDDRSFIARRRPWPKIARGMNSDNATMKIAVKKPQPMAVRSMFVPRAIGFEVPIWPIRKRETDRFPAGASARRKTDRG